MQRRTKAWLTSYRWKVPGRSQPPTVAATPPAPAAAVPVHAVQQESRLGPGPSADGCGHLHCALMIIKASSPQQQRTAAGGRPRGFVHFDQFCEFARTPARLPQAPALQPCINKGPTHNRNQTHKMNQTHTMNQTIQVAPATALAELAARAELAGGSLAEAAALVPAGLTRLCRGEEGQTGTCASSAALAEAVARLETWLIKTRGAELRKVKSSAAALRAVAHVAYAHARCDEEAAQMSGDCTATRRPSEAAVRIELPSEAFVGHVLGRNGRFVRRLLAEHNSVRRIHVQGGPLGGAELLIVAKEAGLQEDVEAVAVKVRYQVFTTIYQSWKYLAAASRGRRLAIYQSWKDLAAGLYAKNALGPHCIFSEDHQLVESYAMERVEIILESVWEEMRTATSEQVALTKQLSAEQNCSLELAFWCLQRAEWNYESASANCAVLLRPSDGVVAAYDERAAARVWEGMMTATSEQVDSTEHLSHELNCSLQLAFWCLQRAEWNSDRAFRMHEHIWSEIRHARLNGHAARRRQALQYVD